MLSQQEIRMPLTEAEGVALLLELLNAAGFETTGWQNGRIQKTIVRLIGRGIADLSELGRLIVAFGVNEYSSGAPLKEFSQSRFNNQFLPAQATQGPARLLSTSSTSYTIEPGQLIGATPDNVTFRNTTGGLLPAGSVSAPASLTLQWQCTLRGSIGNVGRNRLNRLVTPLAGVTLVNDGLADPWYTVSGRDEESDASLHTRNRTKWADLAIELVEEGYENIARKGGAAKVYIDAQNPRGAGTVDVYASGESGLLTDLEMAAIQLAYSRRVFHTDSAWPPSATTAVMVKHPVTWLLNLAGTLLHDPSLTPEDALVIAQNKLREFVRRTPIGGWDYTPGPTRVVLPADLTDPIKDIEGMRSLVLTDPVSPLTVPANALVIEGVWLLVPVAVKKSQQT